MLPLSDDVVTLREPEPGDAAVIIAGRDDEFRRFLGTGSDDPTPTASIVVAGEVVGWVDHDDRQWLEPDECNLGYNVLPDHRGRGYASRAVRLLLAHLAEEGRYRVATLLIDPANEPSLALADRLGFEALDDLDGSRYFRLALLPAAGTT